MSHWESYFEQLYPEVVEAGGIREPLARATLALLASDDYGGAHFVDCRSGYASLPEAVLLVLDVEVGLGQVPVVNDIRFAERIAVRFGVPGCPPAAYPLRDGFPTEIPHFYLAPKGHPRSLCLFEMPTEEVLRIATPLVLLERIRVWLARTAYGELHGLDQPFDPFFANGGRTVILPPVSAELGLPRLFYGYCVSDHPGAPVILEQADQRRWTSSADKGSGMSAILVATQPLAHAQIRMLPRTLAELLDCFDEIGIDLAQPLRKAFRTWLADPNLGSLLEHPCLIIVHTPIVKSDGVVGAGSVKGFLSSESAWRLAECLGALLRVGDHVSFPIVELPVDHTGLQTLSIAPVDIHGSFDRGLARAASGTTDAPDRDTRIAAVGVGALGSQVVLSAVRMGIGLWTLIDHDHLMPHNVARHALSAAFVGLAKAEAVARESGRVTVDDTTKFVVARVDGDPGAGAALSEVDIVLDMSASVPVARWLATVSTHSARTSSVFFNPPGTDLVILREGVGRVPRLDHVEMSYYWLLATNRHLDGHFAETGAGLFPSGGCRQPSLRLPQARVGMLAALAADRLFLEPRSDQASIEIWRRTDQGIVAVRTQASAFEERSCAGWIVSISSDVTSALVDARRAAGELETGGILVGSWDRVRKRVYVVGHYDAPPDSLRAETGFVRGSSGVYRTVEAVETSTAANLTYVGEWHTHPPGYSGRPSRDDEVLLRWIGGILLHAGVPPVMIIAAEDGVHVVLENQRG